MAEFVHLHVHSDYSLLDGLARLPDLVRAAREHGMPALALTDHGTMYGAIDFYAEAVSHGLKPLLGCELYVARRGRQQREHGRDSRPYHLTVLARSAAGYRNLLQLVTRAQFEGFYYKPRVDKELLAQYADGLIILSGCPSAEVARLLRDERVDEARQVLGWYRETFGPENVFIELQRHDGLDFLPGLNYRLVELARQLDIPMVATNDVHYVRAEDAPVQDVLLCIQTGTTVNDPNRMRMGSSFYLRSSAEMADLFAELPEAITNSVRIAEMCELQLRFDQYHLPAFPLPEGTTAQAYLRELCQGGLAERYATVTPELSARLQHELDIIHGMGFEHYFLVVWDICHFARREGLWWNVRGSGAGSLVTYALGIGNLDPLAYGLIFERFLNPARVSLPDIDLDFADDQRDQVMRYVHQRYGQDRVAQIITFGTLGVRAAIRDAGRALDMPLSEVDRIARLVPAVPGMPITLGEVLEGPRAVKEVRELYDTQDYVRRLLDTARSLEGVARHASTHAAGVVVADRPLTHYVPLHRPTRGSSDGLPVTQYPMQAVERLGLLKIDVLGLKTLSVLRRAAELIREHHAVSFNFDNIPLDDPKVYELLSSGEVTGLFQVEGAGMRRLLREMQPSRFEHIMAAISLHRPGPMEYIPDYLARMHGKQPVTYRHPALEPILAETYGIIVYQEQIIRLAQELAGYEPGDADLIRKAVGKKQRDELLEHRNRFIEGALANRVPSDVAAKIFDDIEFFARYGFNKAHAADYALIVCRTAYLKAHYPVEYMTALLNVERGDTERVALIAADCLAMGIAVLPPDINRSQADFSIERLEDGLPAAADGPAGGRAWHQRAIRFGLAAVKNVGQGPVEAILEGRSAAGGGPFSSLEDLGRRVDLRAVQRRALECLTKVGALDSLGARPELLAMLDRMLSYSQAHLEAREAGQMSLFEAGPGGQQESLLGAPGHVEPVSQRQQLAWEKELLGVYLSGHPLRRLGGGLAGDVTAYCGQIDSSLAGQVVTVAGMLTAVRRITTRKGDAMLFASLEDLHGSIELTVFPRVYEATADLWQPDNLLLVRGRVEQRDERVQLVCESAQLYAAGGGQPAGQGNGPAEAPDNGPAAGTPNGALSAYHVFVTVHRSPDEQADVELLRSVYSLLEGYDGRDRFSLVVNKGPGRQVQLDFPNSTTRYCMALVSQLEQLVGEGGVRAQPLS